jgi:hypothetical protein
MFKLTDRIRALLREHPDGLTIARIVDYLGSDKWSIRDRLHCMPDAYIDRWVKPSSGPGRHASVWCVVVPPPNCPKPSDMEHEE